MQVYEPVPERAPHARRRPSSPPPPATPVVNVDHGNPSLLGRLGNVFSAITEGDIPQAWDEFTAPADDPVANFIGAMNADASAILQSPIAMAQLADAVMSGQVGPGEAVSEAVHSYADAWSDPLEYLTEHPLFFAGDVAGLYGGAAAVGSHADDIAQIARLVHEDETGAFTPFGEALNRGEIDPKEITQTQMLVGTGHTDPRIGIYRYGTPDSQQVVMKPVRGVPQDYVARLLNESLGENVGSPEGILDLPGSMVGPGLDDEHSMFISELVPDYYSDVIPSGGWPDEFQRDVSLIDILMNNNDRYFIHRYGGGVKAHNLGYRAAIPGPPDVAQMDAATQGLFDHTPQALDWDMSKYHTADALVSSDDYSIPPAVMNSPDLTLAELAAIDSPDLSRIEEFLRNHYQSRASDAEGAADFANYDLSQLRSRIDQMSSKGRFPVPDFSSSTAAPVGTQLSRFESMDAVEYFYVQNGAYPTEGNRWLLPNGALVERKPGGVVVIGHQDPEPMQFNYGSVTGPTHPSERSSPLNSDVRDTSPGSWANEEDSFVSGILAPFSPADAGDKAFAQQVIEALEALKREGQI